MERVFRSADDDTLIGLVKSAKGRLVVIAPALTKPVASAVADRIADLGTLSMTVILDADPEVYRLGYPDLDARMILVDLIESHGSKGKWFAAAKTAKYLDLALDCAAHSDAAPATLIRAARDFVIKEPTFAAQVGLHAIAHLLAGRGYEPSPLDIDEAFTHVMAASARIGQGRAVLRELQRLATNAATDVIMSARLKSRISDIEKGDG